MSKELIKIHSKFRTKSWTKSIPESNFSWLSPLDKSGSFPSSPPASMESSEGASSCCPSTSHPLFPNSCHRPIPKHAPILTLPPPDFCFFDPTATDTFLLPQRRLGSVPNRLLHDLDSVETLKSEQSSGRYGLTSHAKRTKLLGSRAAFSSKRVVKCIYSYLPYEYALRHRRICTTFNEVLGTIPMDFQAHGERSVRLTKVRGIACRRQLPPILYLTHQFVPLLLPTPPLQHIGGLTKPNTAVRELSLGCPRDTVRAVEMDGLCRAFENGVLPNLRRLHVELHPESGEVGGKAIDRKCEPPPPPLTHSRRSFQAPCGPLNEPAFQSR